MINYKRKSEIVDLGDGLEVELFEPSAFDRLKYVEKLLEVSEEINALPEGTVEQRKTTVFAIGNYKCDLFLIACCLQYGGEDIAEITENLKTLPTQLVSKLDTVAKRLAGMDRQDQDDAEKK